MMSDYVLFSSDLEESMLSVTDHTPLVSFCVPTLNDDETLEKCLESIQTQKYEQIEIIIVDGGSTDRTLEIAEDYTDNIYKESGNLGKARQVALDESTGEIIALWDADAVIPNIDWLSKAARYFAIDPQISTVWPEIRYPPDPSITTKIYCEHTRLIKLDRARSQRGYLGGGKSLIRRKSLETIGGINTDIHWGEDFNWAKRLKKEGYKVLYLEEPVYHNTMRTFSEFYSKQRTGADTFTSTGFSAMGLSLTDILYEQYILGLNMMLTNILFKRDIEYAYYIPYIIVKSLVYIIGIVENRNSTGTLDNDSKSK